MIVSSTSDESGLLKIRYAQAVRRRQEEPAATKSLPEPSGIRTLNWHPLDRLARREPAPLPSDEVAEACTERIPG